MPPAAFAPNPAPADCELLRRTLAENSPDLDAHNERVVSLSVAVAIELDMPVEHLHAVALAAELHDVGKLAIPPSILDKPGPLDDEEWAVMRQHTVIGERLLGNSADVAPVARMVRASHERWDGGGYPDGLAGETIPLGARVITVCDSYDAMTADRVYRAGMTPDAAVAELRRCAGTQFDAAVVEALVRVLGAE